MNILILPNPTKKQSCEFSDNLAGLIVNGNYSGNTVNATFNEDHTTVTVKVTF